jgi:amino acid transporter
MPWQQVATMSMGTVDAFTIAGFPMLGYAAFAISCLGLMTSFLGLFAAAPRLILSLARANMLPEAFAKVHPKYGTPTNALWLILVFTLGFGWLGKGAMLWFLDMGGFTIAIAWVLTVLSLFKIRKQYPHLKGAFRAPNLTLTMMGGIAALIVAVATIIPGTDLSLEWPYEYGMLAVWTILGIVMYMLSCSRNGNDEANLKALLGSDYKKILPLGENEK